MNNKEFDDLVLAVHTKMINRAEFLARMQLPAPAAAHLATLLKLPLALVNNVELGDLMPVVEIDEAPKAARTPRGSAGVRRQHEVLVRNFAKLILGIEVRPFTYQALEFLRCFPSNRLLVRFHDMDLAKEAANKLPVHKTAAVSFLADNVLLLSKAYLTTFGIKLNEYPSLKNIADDDALDFADDEDATDAGTVIGKKKKGKVQNITIPDDDDDGEDNGYDM